MTDSRTGLLKNYGFPVILLISIAVGSTIGALMGKEALVFKPLGDVFINLMFDSRAIGILYHNERRCRNVVP